MLLKLKITRLKWPRIDWFLNNSQPSKRKSTSELNHKHKEMCKWQRQGNSCCLDSLLFLFLTVLHSILFFWVCSVMTTNSICQPHASLDPQQQSSSMRLRACGWLQRLQSLGPHLYAFPTLVTAQGWYQMILVTWQQGTCIDLALWIIEGNTWEGRNWTHPSFPVVGQTPSFVWATKKACYMCHHDF